MYRCEICGKVVEPNTPCNYVILEKREKTYPERDYDPKTSRDRRRYKRQGGKMDDPGGEGWEIAKAAKACPTCAKDRETI
jgi:hypothetical protein